MADICREFTGPGAATSAGRRRSPPAVARQRAEPPPGPCVDGGHPGHPALEVAREVGVPVAVLALEAEAPHVEQDRAQAVALAPRDAGTFGDRDAAQLLPVPARHDARLAVVQAEALLEDDRAGARQEE